MASRSKNNDVWTSIIMLAIAIFIYVQSLSIRSFKGALSEGDPGLAFLPKLAAIALAALSISMILSRLNMVMLRSIKDEVRGLFIAINKGALVKTIKKHRALIGSIVLLVTYPYAMLEWGFILSSLLLLVLLLFLISKMKWYKILATSIFIVLPIFFIFEKLFKIQLP